jgi:hypothetical protein
MAQAPTATTSHIAVIPVVEVKAAPMTTANKTIATIASDRVCGISMAYVPAMPGESA